jgi:hypothetical protein
MNWYRTARCKTDLYLPLPFPPLNRINHLLEYEVSRGALTFHLRRGLKKGGRKRKKRGREEKRERKEEKKRERVYTKRHYSAKYRIENQNFCFRVKFNLNSLKILKFNH